MVALVAAMATPQRGRSDEPTAPSPTQEEAAAEFKALDMDGDGRLSLDTFLNNSAGNERQQKRRQFYDWDANGDDQLSVQEFSARKPVGRPKTANEFRFRDLDLNARLTLEEFVDAIPDEKRPASRRDFKIFDLDGDGELTHEEFITIPSVAAQDQRGPSPDPVVDLLNSRLSELEANWSAWDGDADGGLNRSEFAASNLTRSMPGLGGSQWSDWNRDGDDRLTREEARSLLAAAYGVQRLGGPRLRTESGFVVDWMSFQRVDVDGDDRLDQKEFMDYYSKRPSEEEAQKALSRLDDDGDTTVTFAEWAAQPRRWIDVAARYLRLDANLDGRVDHDELQSGSTWWRTPLAPHVMQAFDLNGDGSLTLAEYRLTPFGNELERWDLWRRDADYDGKLGREEFQWRPGPELSALTAEYFNLLDRDRDESLGYDEFKFNISRSRAPRDVVFQVWDKDENGSLSLAELLRATPEEDRPRRQRDFLVFDWNNDDGLTYEEFLTVPALATPELRGPIPDPIVELVETLMSGFAQKWGAWDQNGDNGLDRSEFSSSGMSRSTPGLALTQWTDWDRDRDGLVSQDDCHRMLEIAFGVQRPDGQPLRTPSGFTLDWTLFQRVDVDGDDRLSQTEYMEFYSTRPSAEEAKKSLEQADADSNGTVTFAEWSALPHRWIDVPAVFLRLDKNLDARVDQEEFQAGARWWREPLAPSIFMAFDVNRDGALTLAEYQLTPFANELERWDSWRRDADNDGRIGPSEFKWGTGPELAALTAEYFRLLDRNADGYLADKEFKFNISQSKAPRRVVFGFWDKDGDGKLTLEEIVAHHKPRSSETDLAFERKIARVEDAFHQADADGSRSLSLQEFVSESAAGTVAPTSRPKGRASAGAVADAESEEFDWKVWGLIGANLLLVGGVAVFLLRRT